MEQQDLIALGFRTLGRISPTDVYLVHPGKNTLAHKSFENNKMRWDFDHTSSTEVFTVLVTCLHWQIHAASEPPPEMIGKNVHQFAVDRMREIYPAFTLSPCFQAATGDPQQFTHGHMQVSAQPDEGKVDDKDPGENDQEKE